MLASERYPSDDEYYGNLIAEAELRQNARRIWKHFPNNGYYYPHDADSSDENVDQDQNNVYVYVSSKEEEGDFFNIV